MRKTITILAILLATCTVANAVTLKRSAFGSVTGSIESGGIKLRAIGGQPFVGKVEGSGTAAKVGLWYTVDPNLPPIADAGPDHVGEGALVCTSPDGAPITLDGSGSSDPNSDPLSYQWLENGAEIATGDGPEVTLGLGTHTITLVVTDPDGLSDQDDVVIEVIDTVVPTLATATEPLTIEAQTADGVPVSDTAISDFLFSALASDDCDADPAVAHDVTGDHLPLGETVVTWTATDASGNSATASQSIHVVDTTAPALALNNLPTKPVPCATAEGSELTFTVTGSDLVTAATDLVFAWSVDGNPVTDEKSSSLTLTLGIGDYTIVATATDAAGNTSSAEDGTFSVSIFDAPPVVAAPSEPLVIEARNADGVLNADPELAAWLASATVTDVCDPNPTLTNDAPESLPLGETTVTWTATDFSGNETEETQMVTVVDTTAPVVATLSAPTEAIECTDSTGTEVTVTVDAADLVSAVDALTYAWSINGEMVEGATKANLTASLDLGVHEIIVRVTDAAGNISAEADGTASVTIQDTTAPAITVAESSLEIEAVGPDGVLSTDAAVAAFLSTVTAEDTCDPDPSLVNDQAGEYVGLGETTVTWTAQDASNNASTAAQTILVLDTTPPMVAAPAAVTVEATSAESEVEIGEATAEDAVGVVSITNDAPDTFPVGQTTVTWTATDAAGNEGTSTQLVTVEDNTAPIVTAPESVTAEATSVETAVEIGDATAGDAVGVVSIRNDAPEMFPVGQTTVTWMATDAAGNEGMATQLVTVEDTTVPIVTAPEPVTVEATSTETAVEIGEASAEDAVGVVSITNDAPETFAIGETIVTWTAADAAGNEGRAIQLVTVEDTTAPEIISVGGVPTAPIAHTGNPISVTLTAQALDVVTPSGDLRYQWFDAAGKSITPIVPQPTYVATVGEIGDYVFRVAAIDGSGNVSELPGVDQPGYVMIEVVDATPPEVTAEVDVEYLWPGNHNYRAVSVFVSALDNSGEDVAIEAVAVSNQADDAKGKANKGGKGDGSTTGDIRVTMLDEEVLLSSNESPEVSFDPLNDLLELRAERLGNDVRIYTVTVTVTDPSGNSATASVDVRVEKEPKAKKMATKPALTKPIVNHDANEGSVAFGTSNYPNPFNPYTIIKYGIPEASQVRLIVYNVVGQQVRVLEDRYQDPGTYAIRWDGSDEFGRPVSSGTYLYRLQAGSNVAVGRMQFVK